MESGFRQDIAVVECRVQGCQRKGLLLEMIVVYDEWHDQLRADRQLTRLAPILVQLSGVCRTASPPS